MAKLLPVIYMSKADTMRGSAEHLLLPGKMFDPTDATQQSIVDTLYAGGVDMLDQEENIAVEWHKLVKQVHIAYQIPVW